MKILFICLGNICRSPAAEGVMRAFAEKAGIPLEIDSAGTAGWHAGSLPDERMRAAATGRGYKLNHRARQVHKEDFATFDHILVMDEQNESDLRRFDPGGKNRAKVSYLMDHATEHETRIVPDPYYGGPEGFDHVLDLLEDACAGLLRKLQGEKATSPAPK
jgi:protein-tyrosine phosphatase